MRILLLEDDMDFANSIIQTFDNQEIEHVDNLLDLDECLYEYPGIDNYKAVLFDLNINMPNLTASDIRKNIKEMPEHDNITMIRRNVKLYGWDYYIHVVCQRDKTNNVSASKFILISGHTNLLKSEGVFSIEKYPGVRLIDKADKDLFEKLTEIIEQDNPDADL